MYVNTHTQSQILSKNARDYLYVLRMLKPALLTECIQIKHQSKVGRISQEINA